MDLLNEYYPLYSENPNNAQSVDEGIENNNHIEQLNSINNRKRRKKILSADDFSLKYGDDMWYIWCIIHDYSMATSLLDKLTFSQFCQMCYENSSKV